MKTAAPFETSPEIPREPAAHTADIKGLGFSQRRTVMVKWPCAAVLGAVVLAGAPAASGADLGCSFSQVTSTTGGGSGFTTTLHSNPSIDATGTRIAFKSGPQGITGDVFLVDTAIGSTVQVTSGRAPAGPTTSHVWMNAEGTRLVFPSRTDHTGENPAGRPQIFLFDATTGTLTQITRSGDFGTDVYGMDASGTRIVVTSTEDLAGENPNRRPETFVFDTTTRAFTQVTHTVSIQGPRISAISGDGRWVAALSNENTTGENPDNNRELFLFDTATGILRQITRTTTTTGAPPDAPSLNGDGSRLAFSMPTAGIRQTFLFDARTSMLTQVTQGTVGSGGLPAIDAMGTRIAFHSEADLTGQNPDGVQQVFLFDTEAESFIQVTRHASPQADDLLPFPAISGDGRWVAFLSNADLTGGNADRNTEIFIATCDASVNDLVALTPLSSTFSTTSDTSGCPAGSSGTFHFAATLADKSGSPALEKLRLQVTTLTNENLLQNADDGPGGVGAVLTVPGAGGYADGILSAGESVDVPFAVCLQDRSPFQLFVDVVGRASQP